MITSEPHRLSDVDRDSLRANCSVCGEVGVYIRKDRNQPVCLNKKKVWSSSRKPAGSTYDRYFRDVEGFYPTLKEDLIEAQEGKCALCGKDITLDKSKLDHCHSQNKVREVLCPGCNVGLGLFKDDVELLQKAIDYLKKHSLR